MPRQIGPTQRKMAGPVAGSASGRVSASAGPYAGSLIQLSATERVEAVRPPMPVDLSGIASGVQLVADPNTGADQAKVSQILSELEVQIAATDWLKLREVILETVDEPLVKQAQQPDPQSAPASLQSSLVVGPFVTGFQAAVLGLDAAGGPPALQLVADTFCQVANDALTQIGVPGFKAAIVTSETKLGQFSFVSWSVKYNPDYLQPKTLPEPSNPQKPDSKAPIDPDYAKDMAIMTYHEAHHAEQKYLMARWAAGQQILDPANIGKKPDPQAVSQKTGILQDIANLACAEPLVDGACDPDQGAMIKTWLKSDEENSAVTGEAKVAMMVLEDARQKCIAQLVALKATPDAPTLAAAKSALGTLMQAKLDVVPKYEAYLALAHEADARLAAYKMEEVWKKANTP